MRCHKKPGDAGPDAGDKLLRLVGLSDVSNPAINNIFQQRRQTVAFDRHVVGGKCDADFPFCSFRVYELTPRKYEALLQ